MVKWYLGTCRLFEFEHWWVSGQIFGRLGHESTKSVRARIAKFGGIIRGPVKIYVESWQGARCFENGDLIMGPNS